MISNKKSHAIKMLQLALALSLLQVDPDNYFYQNFGSWDSQLELRDGDGWELEMLRAVPMVEYPYANRKTMMPLIEDLVLFDRMHASNNQYNVTAYLLNVQGDTANQTAAVQELQAPATVAPNTGPASTGAAALEQAAVNAANATGIGVSDIDLFLNSDHLQDQISIWEQNLADLNDFGELPPSLNTYAGLPMKEEPFEAAYLRLNADAFFPEIAADLSRLAPEGAGALNDSAPNPSDSSCIKIEQSDNNDTKAEGEDNAGLRDPMPGGSSLISKCIKQEEDEAEEIENKEEEEEPLAVELGPFISQVELTQEESEIVEVLWKQDVDLGYTLTPPLNDSSLEEAGGGSSSCFVAGDKQQRSISSVFDDDVERLKALEELKEDKDEPLNDDELNNEWAGIPFTIDNETGEYIRLPLDDLLNDVLRLADFVGEEDDEIPNDDKNDDGIASTSKAAANKVQSNNKHNSSTSKIENENNKNNNDVHEEINSSKNRESNNSSTQKGSGAYNTNHKKNVNADAATATAAKKNTDFDVLPNSEDEASSSLPSPLFDLDDAAKEELADLDIMIQSAAPPFHHHHHHHHVHHRNAPGVQNYAAVGGGANSAFHRQTATGFPHSHHQGRVPLARGVSMEQRLQDIASLFNPIPSMGVGVGVSDMTPYPHYPSHYAYQGGPNTPQHAQYPPPPPPPPHPHSHTHPHTHPHPHPHHHHHHGHQAMLHANATLGVDICSSAQSHFGHNLGTAVSSSMHLTNTGHDQDAVGTAGASASAYKMEHEMMYYTNASSDMNHTTDGFINSILNDEDLHLMDMNVNESFCRMVDVNNSTSNNSSVLGLSSGHASAGTGSSHGLSMSGTAGGGSGGVTVAGAPATNMTSEMMTAAGASGGDRLDASSDSAVSSMGSERVPSLSDGEWGEGSDSAQDYHQGKYGGGGPYDYSYSNHSRLNDGTRQPPVAQKKHQMFGRRYLQEQPGLDPAGVANGTAADGAVATAEANSHLQAPPPPIKYEYESYPPVVGGIPHSGGDHAAMGGEGAMGPVLLSKEMQAYDLKYANGPIGGGYSLDFSLRPPRTAHDIIQHNHTYTLPQSTGSMPRPQQRDKKFLSSSSSPCKSSKSSLNGEDEHLTRDEKRARALNIPIAVRDVINLPMDEFNERLSKYDLTENQLSLIRDIRRRGKNKVAAQNCRKRKLDQILSLEDEVKEVRRRKDQLCMDRDSLEIERKRISTKFATLHRHIFQYLRDPDGNPCSPSEYSLQQAADGSIYLLPRDNNNKTDAAGGVTVAATRQQHGGANGSSSHLNLVHHHHHHQHMTQAANNQQQQRPQAQQQHPHSHLTQQHQQQQQQQQQQQALPQHPQTAAAAAHHSAQQNPLQSQQKE